MTINDIYTAAKDRGLVRSLRQFSRDLLGRAENYAADTGLQRCSAAVLINLYRRLGELNQHDLAAATFRHLLEAEARFTRCQEVAR